MHKNSEQSWYENRIRNLKWVKGLDKFQKCLILPNLSFLIAVSNLKRLQERSHATNRLNLLYYYSIALVYLNFSIKIGTFCTFISEKWWNNTPLCQKLIYVENLSISNCFRAIESFKLFNTLNLIISDANP